MADEENVVSFGEKQETPAEEKRPIGALDIVPITLLLFHISCMSPFPLAPSELIHPIVLFLVEVHHFFDSTVHVTIVLRVFPPSFSVS